MLNLTCMGNFNAYLNVEVFLKKKNDQIYDKYYTTQRSILSMNKLHNFFLQFFSHEA